MSVDNGRELKHTLQPNKERAADMPVAPVNSQVSYRDKLATDLLMILVTVDRELIRNPSIAAYCYRAADAMIAEGKLPAEGSSNNE